ncbi:hypothetical protein R5R35_010754 [Gryllus longicercus]|uniref:Uncharacterized protein n=1 Tax=Gryllus longicercus TaxID=2509291 RepID=A0AAN9YXA7_9ORTH
MCISQRRSSNCDEQISKHQCIALVIRGADLKDDAEVGKMELVSVRWMAFALMVFIIATEATAQFLPPNGYPFVNYQDKNQAISYPQPPSSTNLQQLFKDMQEYQVKLQGLMKSLMLQAVLGTSRMNGMPYQAERMMSRYASPPTGYANPTGFPNPMGFPNPTGYANPINAGECLKEN